MLSPNFGLTVNASENVDECVTDTTKVTQFASMQEFLFNSSLPAGAAVDIVELCGGMAATSRMLVRRGCITGLNFNIVVGFDVEDRQNEQFLYVYIYRFRTLVFI